MPKGLVLVIGDDEEVTRPLTSALRDAGYDVVTSTAARPGLETACAIAPDCIVCDVDLQSGEGFWFARSLRTHPSAVSVTPIVYVSSPADARAHESGVSLGADACVPKPASASEIVAHVDALAPLAPELRERRDSLASVPPDAFGAAIDGDLGQLALSTVLTVLELERRSGSVDLFSKTRRARLEIAGGRLATATIAGTEVPILTALRTTLAWKVGRFRFTPAPPREPPRNAQSTSALMLEAARLDDEAGSVPLIDGVPGRRAHERRSIPPALGGPPVTPADFAPPSSRRSSDGSDPPISLDDSDLLPDSLAASSASPGRVSLPPPDDEIPIVVEVDGEIVGPASVPPSSKRPSSRPPARSGPAVRALPASEVASFAPGRPPRPPRPASRGSAKKA